MKLLKAPALPPQPFTHIPIFKFTVILLHMKQQWCQWHDRSSPHCLIHKGRWKSPGIQTDDHKEGRETLKPKEQQKESRTPPWPHPLHTENWYSSGTWRKAVLWGLKKNKERNAISGVTANCVSSVIIRDSGLTQTEYSIWRVKLSSCSPRGKIGGGTSACTHAESTKEKPPAH